MSTIIVALEDIVTDETKSVDLSSLSPDEAAEEIKRIYSFFATSVEVEIQDGIAAITLPEADAQRINQSLRTLDRASTAAARGRYQQAIPLYREVLKSLPEHTGARRELAMALMETGSHAAAKSHLIRVLQLDPDDAWAFLILGNIYFHSEKDLGSAERYYQSATDLEPDDPYILNAYGALMATRGNLDRAEELFSQAIAVGGDQPNPVVGLAMVYAKTGRTDDAIVSLEQLLKGPKVKDSRADPVYEQARQDYLALRRSRAEENRENVLERLRVDLDAYSAATGIAVEIENDSSLDTNAKVEMAWRYGRTKHVIKTRGDVSPYLIAHEFEHVLLDSAARSAEVNRLFFTHQGHTETALRIIEKDVRKLRGRRNLPQHLLDQYIGQIVSGIVNQLYNAPLDMVIDANLYARRPYLHDDQFAWLAQEQDQHIAMLADTNIRNSTPTKIYQANVAMNAASALFADNLFGGVTDYASAYAASGMLPTGRRLYDLFQETDKSVPGSEYDLVDAWARELKLEGWFDWQPDREPDPFDQPGGLRDPGPEGGPSNPELLEDAALQMAATMYMVSALKRFKSMSEGQIREVAQEIAITGLTGLDYASSDLKYSVNALPGERFSGLQMMCLMYVAFKHAFPELDSGVPLDKAYEQAQRLYNLGME